MEYVSLKFPNFADTARIHYATTDFAKSTVQVWCAGGLHISYYPSYVSVHYPHSFYHQGLSYTYNIPIYLFKTLLLTYQLRLDEIEE